MWSSRLAKKINRLTITVRFFLEILQESSLSGFCANLTRLRRRLRRAIKTINQEILNKILDELINSIACCYSTVEWPYKTRITLSKNGISWVTVLCKVGFIHIWTWHILKLKCNVYFIIFLYFSPSMPNKGSIGTGILHYLALDFHSRIIQWLVDDEGRCGRLEKPRELSTSGMQTLAALHCHSTRISKASSSSTSLHTYCSSEWWTGPSQQDVGQEA